MSRPRSELSVLLRETLGSNHVYFQPPESIKITYPAIVYALDSIPNVHADDGVYLSQRRYAVTVVDKDPDSAIAERVAQLPCCRFNRHYTSDNLHHFAFTLCF